MTLRKYSAAKVSTTQKFSASANNFRAVARQKVSVNILAAGEIPPDNTYINYSTLLLAGDGTNNATNNTFLDSSTNNYTITRNGNITQGAVSPYANQLTSGSGLFNGTTDYFSTSSTTSLNFSGAYTVECWFRLTQNLTSQTQGGGNYLGRLISSKGTGSFEFYVGSASGATNVASAIAVSTYGGSGGPSGYISASGLTLSLNTWYHVVAVRNASNVASLFLNGSRIATATVSGTYASNPVFVGGDTTVGYLGYFPGFIGQTRAVNGTAVYDPTLTTLTVPTSPLTAITNTSLLLNFGNAGIYDSKKLNNFETFGSAKISTTQSKFGGSSISFNGSTDYLVTRTAESNFAFGTGDFTIECWIYPTSRASGNGVIWDTRPLAQPNTTGYQIFAVSSTGVLTYGSGAVETFGGTVSLNTWSHAAVSRSNGNVRLFLNGTQVGSTVADSVNYGAVAGRPVIGSDANNPASVGYSFAGYIDELQVTKGYARYTTNFTPPTSAFTS